MKKTPVPHVHRMRDWHGLLFFIPQWSYDIEDIYNVIRQKWDKAGKTMLANTNILKAVMILENSYQVDFLSPALTSSVLGFNNDLYTTDYQESENPVNIISVNSILVNIDST